MTETNRAIARIFLSMAELLATRQANPHRVRAYRRAAEALSILQEDVAVVAQRGELQNIPGIGRDLSCKILEFLKTGTVRDYEDIKNPLPPEVESWTTLPGLSEAVVQHLFGRLGIRTLDDLETLVRSHLLQTLPGVRVPEEELLAAIQARREAKGLP
ncbi:MAG TPA: histidinol-phosphatase [Nitrospiraceae bacterium]|jgi:DNA polymerase (family 10)|nr:histidinol-phosphatase [Nitrospiraceae bacterium]